jgi:hypothetical protein
MGHWFQRFATVSMFTAISAAALTACVSHDYAGQTFAPTQSVQVFYDASNVPPGFEVIGRDRAETTEYMTTENIIADTVKKAQQVGADAILVEGVDTVEVGSTTSTRGSDDGKTEYYATQDGQLHTRHTSSGEWKSNSYTTTSRDKVVTVKFLKRK